MTIKNEEVIDEKYKKLGYSVLKSGWPDRIYFKYNEEGEIIETVFVEIKINSYPLNNAQKTMKNFIEKIWKVPYKIERVDSETREIITDGCFTLIKKKVKIVNGVLMCKLTRQEEETYNLFEGDLINVKFEEEK